MMKKITVQNLIDFRRKSNKNTKATFVNNLRKEKKKSEDGAGGDYWITSLSAISNSYKNGDEDLLDQKIDELESKIAKTQHQQTKTQFQRNIDILNAVKEIDLNDYKPDVKLTFLKQQKINYLIPILGLSIESKPKFIFTFTEENDKEIGGAWFVAKLGGYRKNELNMFAEMLFRYLDKHYSNEYYVNAKFCIVLDVTDCKSVSYQEILNGSSVSLLDETINEIKKF